MPGLFERLFVAAARLPLSPPVNIVQAHKMDSGNRSLRQWVEQPASAKALHGAELELGASEEQNPVSYGQENKILFFLQRQAPVSGLKGYRYFQREFILVSLRFSTTGMAPEKSLRKMLGAGRSCPDAVDLGSKVGFARGKTRRSAVTTGLCFAVR